MARLDTARIITVVGKSNFAERDRVDSILKDLKVPFKRYWKKSKVDGTFMWAFVLNDISITNDGLNNLRRIVNSGK